MFVGELQAVKLKPTETKLRRRDGQVVLERRSEDGIQGQVLGHEAPPEFLQDQAKGLSRLKGKVFDGDRWVSLEVPHCNAAELNSAAASQSLSVVTYNVWFSDFRQKPRAEALFAILEHEDADIICLQEVTLLFLSWLRKEPFVQESYMLSDVLGTTFQGFLL
eukprot:symbB.v1.2.037876.t1/scaffold5719.1/size24260/2